MLVLYCQLRESTKMSKSYPECSSFSLQLTKARLLTLWYDSMWTDFLIYFIAFAASLFWTSFISIFQVNYTYVLIYFLCELSNKIANLYTSVLYIYVSLLLTYCYIFIFWSVKNHVTYILKYDWSHFLCRWLPRDASYKLSHQAGY